MSSPDISLLWQPAGSCNICGGRHFGPGPLGRMSSTGKAPACTTCGSLERHRALRAIFDALPLGLFYRANLLQFSLDTALEPRWFRSFERSVFGGENSLDLQRIDRPDGSYGLVSLNHVIEFVPDARKSFNELVRICQADGLIQIGFSGADTRPACLDYDTPTGAHGCYHLFGRDLATYFDLPALGMQVNVQWGRDSVTDVVESFHFFTRRQEICEILSRRQSAD